MLPYVEFDTYVKKRTKSYAFIAVIEKIIIIAKSIYTTPYVIVYQKLEVNFQFSMYSLPETNAYEYI